MSAASPYDGGRPPRPRAGGERTRDTILHAAASLAAVLGMSKSGLSKHFGSKQELQLATVAEAARVFDAEVVQPALAAAAGLGQLTAVCEAFFAHLERQTFPGGCFMATAALEMSTRP